MVSTVTSPLIYLVAGEASGDLLGGHLMEALRARHPGCRFMGVGGACMAAQGLTSLFPMEELSIMGILEILPHAKRLLGRIHEVARHIASHDPDVVVTIDSPGFNFRLAKKLRAQDKRRPLVHYVAPSVWAWRPGRAKKIAPLFDHLLTLLPFEPPYFQAHGLATTFVGHPLIEEARLSNIFDQDFRERFGIENQAPLVCCLVGSRRSEVARLLPVFSKTLKDLQKCEPSLRVVCPVLPAFAGQVRAALLPEIEAVVVEGADAKYQAFQASNAALAASGTVALELALAGTPMIVAYKINALTAFLIKPLIKTPFACLVNILMGRALVPEFIQERAAPEHLTFALEGLLGAGGHAQKEALPQVRALLSPPQGRPSALAAQVVLSFLS